MEAEHLTEHVTRIVLQLALILLAAKAAGRGLRALPEDSSRSGGAGNRRHHRSLRAGRDGLGPAWDPLRA